MKRPEAAPSLKDIMATINHEELGKLFSPPLAQTLPTVHGKYLHWSELRHRDPPEGFDHKLWWATIKLARSQPRKVIPLQDAGGTNFSFGMPDMVLEMLYKIDGKATGQVAISDQITNPDTRNRYIVSSLILEAIRSSQLEGASTSRKVASNMLRSGRKPKDRNQRMILNNYLAMRHIRDIKGEDLIPERVLELHKMVTDQTLEDSAAAGKLQTNEDERVRVFDNKSGKILHVPPSVDQLPGRLKALCVFANEEHTGSNFIHPIIKAIILHFWIGFDHPFEDGNGRLARALFYWSMLRQNYWLFEFLSISGNIRKAPAKYGYAYLYSETDENDLTYFIIQQLQVIISSIADLEKHLHKKIQQVAVLEGKLKKIGKFNHRQLALLSHALRGYRDGYTIGSHQRSHGIAYATARADLLTLQTHDLLFRGSEKSKAMRFYPVENLNEIIRKLSA
ncbi:MAG: Fic family protein [Proteobacteria bacterium]|nr:Fic family protein [Pseudomonadota bacterium]